MADDEQSSLITNLKGRNRSAWSAAVDRHLHEVYGFIFHLVGGDRTVAEDMNQETWQEALDGIDQCNAAQGSFRNWLFGIARKRVALHYRRRALTGNPTSLSNPFPEAGELGDTEKGTVPICRNGPTGASHKWGLSPFPNISVLPEDVLEQVERVCVVRAAILLLPDDRREVLLGKYVEGLSVETIAVRMQKTAKAVESLLSRAREQMRALLGGYMMPCGNERRASRESSHE